MRINLRRWLIYGKNITETDYMLNYFQLGVTATDTTSRIMQTTSTINRIDS